MKSRRRLVLLALFVLVLISAFLYVLPLLRTGAGYAAKMACSCRYLQDASDLDTVRTQRLNFSVLGHVSLQENTAEKSVQASFYGLAKRKAYYIPGRGCVLVNDPHLPLPTPIELPQPPLSIIASDMPLKPDSTTFVGVDAAALESAIDFGMQPVDGGGALGIVALRNGKLLTERYAPGINAETRLLGWSMSKSITAALIGMRVADGAIDLNKKPVFEQWANKAEYPDPRSAIALEDLLQMNSGLDWEEAYGSVTDATIMLYDQANMSAYARKKKLAHPPGTINVYSSGTTNILMDLVMSSFPNQEEAITWMYDSLFYAIGANSFLFETDQSGRPVGSSYGWAKARDWAKLGQLFLQKGEWNDRQVLPEGWVDYLCEKAPGSAGEYGGQIWFKGPDMPSMPEEAFMFRGFQDQRVFIFPSQELVVVRLGHNKDKTADFDGFVSRILAAF
ncbi:MAG: serine hydrolase [Bacteroidota bacterium]